MESKENLRQIYVEFYDFFRSNPNAFDIGKWQKSIEESYDFNILKQITQISLDAYNKRLSQLKEYIKRECANITCPIAYKPYSTYDACTTAICKLDQVIQKNKDMRNLLIKNKCKKTDPSTQLSIEVDMNKHCLVELLTFSFIDEYRIVNPILDEYEKNKLKKKQISKPKVIVMKYLTTKNITIALIILLIIITIVIIITFVIIPKGQYNKTIIPALLYRK